MPNESNPVSRSELLRILQQYADGLRAAGVEWLPRQVELPLDLAAAGAATPEPDLSEDPVPVSPPTSLFDQPPPPKPVLTLEQKRRALEVLDTTKVKGCPRCKELAATRNKTVFGVGNPNAQLCFIGEAPGGEEDRTGEPFVGPAGQLLNRIIAACKFRREDVYICNVLKCRPPNNRTPMPDEVQNCRPYLEEQLDIVGPKFICALGAPAAQWLTGTTLSIGKLRGRFHNYRGIPVLCTYHPAYLLRNPSAKRDVWEDMKLLLAKMGRPVG